MSMTPSDEKCPSADTNDQGGLPLWRCMDICCWEGSRCSTPEKSLAAWEYAKSRLEEMRIRRKTKEVVFQGKRATPGVILTQARCLGLCREGPLARVDDEGGVTLYTLSDEEALDKIIKDHLIEGKVAHKYVKWMSRGKQHGSEKA